MILSWLEDQYKKQRKEVMSWGIRPGDFINLNTQFGDVWSEVKEYLGTYIIIYRHEGKGRETMMVDTCAVHKMCKKENVDKIRTCHIITSKEVIKRKFPMDGNAYCFAGDKRYDW